MADYTRNEPSYVPQYFNGHAVILNALKYFSLFALLHLVNER